MMLTWLQWNQYLCMRRNHKLMLSWNPIQAITLAIKFLANNVKPASSLLSPCFGLLQIHLRCTYFVFGSPFLLTKLFPDLVLYILQWIFHGHTVCVCSLRLFLLPLFLCYNVSQRLQYQGFAFVVDFGFAALIRTHICYCTEFNIISLLLCSWCKFQKLFKFWYLIAQKIGLKKKQLHKGYTGMDGRADRLFVVTLGRLTFFSLSKVITLSNGRCIEK